MKKVLKSRIFIVVITLVIGVSGTLYATTKYQASEILYNGSDGTSMDVNEALNELYNKGITECEKDKFCSKVKLGDYIKMTPIETTYTILSNLTGYSSAQTINPSELNLWRVIKKNDDGTIEMISEYASNKSICFYSQTGYLNFVGTLNLIASQYGNSKYTINSRIMGYNGQTSTITDTSKFMTTAPWASSTIDNSNEILGGGDEMFRDDVKLVREVLKKIIVTTPSGTTTGYWLGSRRYNYVSSTVYFFSGYYVKDSGSISDYLNYYSLYYYKSGWIGYSGCLSIRPIVILKSGLTVTGSGTSDDPWVLE